MSKKSVLTISIVIVSLLTSPNSGAVQVKCRQKYKLYVGLDAQVRRMNFQRGYGDNLLRDHSPQRNFYAGVKLNDWIGIETGYEVTRTTVRNSTLHTGDIAVGTVIPAALSPAVFRTNMKIQGPHVSLIGSYSLREDLPVQLIGSVGGSFFKASVERKGVSISSPPIPGRVRTFSKRKTVLRIMGGLEYMWNCHLGMRASIGLVKTGNLVIVTNDGAPGPTNKIKPKDSIVYGLGIFWAF